MNQNKSGIQDGREIVAAMGPDHEISESSLAVQEFAALVRKGAPRQRASIRRENYEVHPCKRVRGYVLRLPVIGWTLWYPTAAAALSFAEKLAGIYLAECCLYDAEGSLHVRRTIADLTPPSGSN